MRLGFFVGVIFCQAAIAQIQPTDSLVGVLNRSVGTTRVDVLNQLTYELISRDNTKAMQYCAEALALSRKIDYKKGEGVARSYRGVYEYLSGEFSNGRMDLRDGLQLAREAGDRQNEAYSLLQLGNSYLDQAILDSSLLSYNKAYEILRDSLDPVNLSKLYRNLATLHGLRSDVQLRDTYILRALAIRERTGNKYYIADALILLAGFRISDGDYKAAEELLNRAEKIVQSNPGDRENLNDLGHQRALILLRQRKFDEAFILLDSARNFYLRTSFLQKFATLQTDLGRMFFDRGEYETALKHLYEAIRVAELKGFQIQLLDALIQIGWTEFSLDEYERSGLLADSILHVAERLHLPNRIAEGLTLKGVILTEMKDFSAGRTALEKALTIRQRLGDKSRVGEAYLNLGYLEHENGNLPMALSLFEKSLALANESNYDIGKAWSSLGLGNVYLNLKDYPRSEKFLSQAEQIARLIQSNRVLIYAYEARRDLLARQSKFRESLQYAIALDRLKDSLQRSDLTRRFANMVKIDEIERRDRNIKYLTQEKELADQKIAVQDASLRQQFILLIAGSVGIVLLAGWVFFVVRTNLRIKRLNTALSSSRTNIQNQANELQEANTQLSRLYDALSDQKEEIQSQSDKLSRSYEQISILNKNLENLVAEKTKDIQLTNEELVKQNTDLLQFSYTVSHNMRGPVARLLGLNALIQTSNSDDERKHYFSLIQKTTQDLDLILKDLSKIIDLRNDLNTTRENVDLESEWLKCCEMLQESIREQFDISFDFSAAPQLLTIKPIIQSIFYNLLSNAIKYRSPERALIVNARARHAGDHAILEVTDNGLGMDTQKHRDSIFKLFKRFHTHVEGRGLGLFLIKSQVTVLKGSIEVHSQVDKGTTFKVILPVRGGT